MSTVTRSPSRRRILLAAAATAALTAPLLLPSVAATAAVDVQGKVVFVADGDTFDVDVYGDGTSTPLRVRTIGMNTMEQSVYSQDLSKIKGDCHSTEATRRLHSLINGKVVRVTSRYASSMTGKRYRRSIDVKIDGVWRDVHLLLMKEGHGLFLSHGVEYRKNLSYMKAAQQAKIAGRNVWDPDYCGAGPAANLTVAVSYNPSGEDARNLNGEYVKVTNRGTNAVSLAGWHVRDGGPTNYNFPGNASVAPGGSVYVHVGSGTNTATHFYWGRSAPMFDNVSAAPQNNGEGGYLFDPKGNLRASQMYPCLAGCPAHPLKGKLAISKIMANPDGADTAKREYVNVKNISKVKVGLGGQVLSVGSVRYRYKGGTVLAPGEVVKLSMGKGTPTRRYQFVGRTRLSMANGGGVVRVLSSTGEKLVCRSYGTGRC